MTALAATALRPSRNLGVRRSYPCGVDIFYKGALIMINAAGYAMPAAAAVSNKGCVGVCEQEVDNSGGSAGDLTVPVQEGEFLITGTTLAQTVVGALCYAEDDDTIDETQSSNEPLAGVVSEMVSSTQAWVAMSLANSKL